MSGATYAIRELRSSDASAVVAAYARNREHLRPWEPVRPPAFFTVKGQQETIEKRLEQNAAGGGFSWVIATGTEVVGRVELSNVARGVFQSCSIGYWVDHDHTGRGLATLAVETACERAKASGLHRVEAATLPANQPSQRVLVKCGFTLVGTAPGYLFIAGAWQDHRIYQRLLHASPPS